MKEQLLKLKTYLKNHKKVAIISSIVTAFVIVSGISYVMIASANHQKEVALAKKLAKQQEEEKTKKLEKIKKETQALVENTKKSETEFNLAEEEKVKVVEKEMEEAIKNNDVAKIQSLKTKYETTVNEVKKVKQEEKAKKEEEKQKAEAEQKKAEEEKRTANNIAQPKQHSSAQKEQPKQAVNQAPKQEKPAEQPKQEVTNEEEEPLKTYGVVWEDKSGYDRVFYTEAEAKHYYEEELPDDIFMKGWDIYWGSDPSNKNGGKVWTVRVVKN